MGVHCTFELIRHCAVLLETLTWKEKRVLISRKIKHSRSHSHGWTYISWSNYPNNLNDDRFSHKEQLKLQKAFCADIQTHLRNFTQIMVINISGSSLHKTLLVHYRHTFSNVPCNILILYCNVHKQSIFHNSIIS